MPTSKKPESSKSKATRSSDKRSFFDRFALALVLLLLLPTPWILSGARHALQNTSNDPRQWLPHGFVETETYDWFQQHFGIDEMAVVSWPGCTLDDERVDLLAESLVPNPSTKQDGPHFFQRALSGRQFVRQLTSEPTRLSRERAVDRLRGTIVGQDGETTCLLLVVSEHGVANRAAAVQSIYDVARDKCGLTAQQLRLGGPTVDAAAIDVESRRLLLQLAALSACVSFALAWLRLKTIRLAVIVLFTAIYSTAVSLAVLYFSGGEMNLVMTMLPPLVYILTISGAVHMVNYYRDALGDGTVVTAPSRAVINGWFPCGLASGTTAIGMLSLATSRIVPIRQFGIYSAIGLLISLGVLLLLLPSVLQIWRPAKLSSARKVTTSGSPSTRRFVDVVLRQHVVVVVACLAAMACLGAGLSRIETTVRLQDRFLPQSQIIQHYAWLEQHLGPLVPLEVVVCFDESCSLTFLDRAHFVQRVEQEIRKTANETMSAIALLPPRPAGGGVRDVIKRAVLNRRLLGYRQELIDAHYLAETPRQQLWRISVRVNALGDVDYGHFVDLLRQKINPFIDGQKVQGVNAVSTGVIPLMYKAQRELLNDLARSFLTAFVAIAIVMVVVLRSVRAGLLVMIPNLFPAVVIFGGMGVLDITIQIGSVMTASAALGIAVDDTFHFLTWYRRGIQAGMSRADAIRFAYDRCAGAMIHTTLVCGAGLIVFALSSFVPILHFAWLMVTLLTAALVGDLILLPAILAGRFGLVFSRSNKTREAG